MLDTALPVHLTLRHPVTGRSLRAVGLRRSGRPIWPVMGAEDDPPKDPPNDPPKDPPNGPPKDPPKDPPKPDMGEHGYPLSTPVAEMTITQQAAYWKHQSRKHEDTVKSRADYPQVKKQLEDLRKSTENDQEKAVREAREAATAEANDSARKTYGARLVDAEIKAVSAGRLTDDQRAALLDGLDRARFLTDAGDVDAAKVRTFVDGIAPADADNGRFPDLGQGRRPGSAQPSVSSGRELYEQRRKK